MKHSTTFKTPLGRRRVRHLALGIALASSFALHEGVAQDPSTTGPDPKSQAARRPPEGLNFANALYRDRRYDLAAEEYEKFLATAEPGPDADDARYGLANAFLFLGKYKDARRVFEQFAEAAPRHINAPTALYRVGETAYLLGDLPASRIALERFTSTNPTHRHAETAWSHLGDVYLRSGDLPKAKEAYRVVLKTASGPLAHRARLGLGRALLTLGEYDAAVSTLADLAKTGGPEWLDKAWFETGRVELAAARYDRGVTAFETLEKLAPKSPLLPESKLLRAEALGRLNRRDEAEALLGPLVASPSPNLAAPAADALGVSLLARGEAEKALALFDDALKKYEKTSTAPVLAFHSGEASRRLGRIDDARSRFLKLAETFPNDPLAESAVLRAAELALEARDFAAARESASAFAARFPKSVLNADAQLIEGRAALGSGEAKEAIRTLATALADAKPTPRTAQAIRYYLGLAYRADGQAEKADEVLGMLAKTSDPAAVDAQFLVGQGHVEAGRFAEAIPALESYLERKPKGDVADFALSHIAHAQLELGRLDAAQATLDALTARFPKSKALPRTRLRVAESALSAKSFDRAAGLFALAAETDDPQVKARALSGLGWAKLGAGQGGESAEAFARLLAAAPDHALAADGALARGRALERDKQVDQAIAAYALTAKNYPKSDAAGPALLAQARLLVEAKRPSEAVPVFEAVVKDYLKNAGEPLDGVLVEWAWATVDSGKVVEADKIFERILQEFPESPHAAEARFNLADSAFASRRFEPIAAWLAPVIAAGTKAEPALVQKSLYRLGRTQVERKQWSEAAKSFARLADEFPSGPYRREARFWKAESLFQSGDVKGAEPEFAALSKEPPTPSDPPTLLASARRRRVQALAQLERWADTLAAADAFKSDFPKDPQLPEIAYSRGRALGGLAKFDEARLAYDEVIVARKGTELAAKAQFMRGESYFHQKTYRDALREFLKVDYLYDSPEWQAAALLEAGKVHEQLAQWAEAAETYERLRSKFPADSNAAKALERLDAVRRRIATAPVATDRAESSR